MEKTYDLIIIGSGPAGLTSAIYACRGNLKVLVIENDVNGGKLSKISQIENYPGFESISGIELSEQLLHHAKHFNAQIINGEVIKIDDGSIILNNGDIYFSKAVIIATGSKQRKLDLEYAEQFTGRGISYCATCDGFFFKNKPVIVIGDSNEAFEEALFLSSLANKVSLISRRALFPADKNLVDRFLNLQNTEIIKNSLPLKLIIEEDKIKGLLIKDLTNNDQNIIVADGIFPYLSFNPNSDFLDPSILNDKGYIKVNSEMSTAIPGIFAAGDCIEKNLRQIVTACSDGAIAASSAIKYLKNNN